MRLAKLTLAGFKSRQSLKTIGFAEEFNLLQLGNQYIHFIVRHFLHRPEP